MSGVVTPNFAASSAIGCRPVSIDSRKSGVMNAALGAGATLVNDVSALTWDPLSAGVVAAAGAPVVLMHHQGDPTTMQDAPRYDDALVEVFPLRMHLEPQGPRRYRETIDFCMCVSDPPPSHLLSTR